MLCFAQITYLSTLVFTLIYINIVYFSVFLGILRTSQMSMCMQLGNFGNFQAVVSKDTASVSFH